MFNKEKILAQKVDRLKWYMSTDKLDFKNKQFFIRVLVLEILRFYYGNLFSVFIKVNSYFIRDIWLNTKVKVTVFWYCKILKYSSEEFDAKVLNCSVDEIRRLKNGQND